MRISRFVFLWMAAAILFLYSQSAVPLHGQTSFDRPRIYDVQHYTLRVRFDRAKKVVYGDSTVTLTPLSSEIKQVELDAVGLAFTSVRLNDAAGQASYKATADKVTVMLDRAYKPGELINLRFLYSTKPKKGIYFVPASIENGKEVRSEQIWTQGEAEEARYWFPSFDFPSDKATTEEYINAQKDETVIGNGELVERIEEADGTVTHHFKMDIPHSTYLVSFVIGKYVKVTDESRGVPLGFHVYPGRESIVPLAFGDTGKMLAAFEDLTGVKFPYNKYDQTIVAGFQEFSGMENITATTLADQDVFFANFEFGRATVEDLVSHELAHSWFGDIVTCQNWSELWLNEGFATFMEAASREKLFGRDSYIRKLRSDVATFLADEAINKKRHALVNQLAKPDNSLFDVTTYQKGGAVVHMLREEMGDEAFWKAINTYLNRHKYANVRSTDLQKAMEEASGKDLGWFFQQWVYSSGYPKLTMSRSYNAAGKTLTVTLTQTQAASSGTPLIFRLPMELEITTNGGKTTEHVVLDKRTAKFNFKVDGEPTSVKLDPRDAVILKTVKDLTR
jgi:aminopeptidase N